METVNAALHTTLLAAVRPLTTDCKGVVWDSPWTKAGNIYSDWFLDTHYNQLPTGYARCVLLMCLQNHNQQPW